MHTRSLLSATRYFLQSYWSLESGCEVKLTDAPGRPLQCMSSWAITVWDGQAQQMEGTIGLYPRCGCMVTLSAKLDGELATDPERFLFLPRTGFYDTRDALVAFLHRKRWDILEWANLLVNGEPLIGIVNNITVAPRPLSVTAATRRGPEWWGGTVGKIVNATGQTEESRVVGYSADITFGAALSMQTDNPPVNVGG